MVAYSKILYDIEKIIILVKNDLTYKIDQNIMTNILSSLEKLREDNLEFPEKIWRKYNTEYKKKLSIDYDMTSSDTIKILAHTFKEKPEIITYSNNKSDDITLDNLNLDSKTPPKDKINPTPSVLYAEEKPKESNQNITIDIDSKTI
jgi:HSP90 family molecular chaperone